VRTAKRGRLAVLGLGLDRALGAPQSPPPLSVPSRPRSAPTHQGEMTTAENASPAASPALPAASRSGMAGASSHHELSGGLQEAHPSAPSQEPSAFVGDARSDFGDSSKGRGSTDGDVSSSLSARTKCPNTPFPQGETLGLPSWVGGENKQIKTASTASPDRDESPKSERASPTNADGSKDMACFRGPRAGLSTREPRTPGSPGVGLPEEFTEIIAHTFEMLPEYETRPPGDGPPSNPHRPTMDGMTNAQEKPDET